MALPEGPYNPTEYEKAILDFWLKNGYYRPEYNPEEDKMQSTEEMKSSIAQKNNGWALICPPPNAYARPHIGNISGYAYQDAMARYARMRGKRVLVLPGKDHAGLEGEGVFVREVLDKQGRSKFEMSREDFYKEIYEFNMVNKAKALEDEKRIGLSADFDRDTFTLDPRVVDTVLDTFIKMYNAGMIYKGVRIVNWDPKARTAVADNQTVREERDGKLHHIKYPIVHQRAWKLSFYNQSILERIEDGSKTIETRALNPEEPERYFGDIKPGDLIICVDKSEAKSASIYKKVKSVQIYKSFEEILEKIDQKNVFSKIYSSTSELKDAYNQLAPHNGEKIEQNGMVAIELEDLTENDYLIVATTRPETLLGDTAVAMNPSDTRYANLKGKQTVVPLVDRIVPIISSYKVEEGFGTGYLKVTPAHSQDDYQIMMDWNTSNPNQKISAINVIDTYLKLCGPIPDRYLGMKYKEALPLILENLHANNLYVKEEIIKQNILIAERTKAPIEPLLSSQWYLKYDKPDNNIKEAAIKMVVDGTVEIHPENMVDKFNHWMENLRDWAISRSLWWGYRLPVWYHGEVKEEIDENGNVKEMIKLSESTSNKVLLIDGIKTIILAENPDEYNTFQLNTELADYLKGIGNRVVILTNVSGEGLDKMKSLLAEYSFDIYTTHKELMKTESAYFKRLAVEHNLDLSNCIYLDRKEEHLFAAKEAGININGIYDYDNNSAIKWIAEQSSEWIPLEYGNPEHLKVQLESPGEGWHQDDDVLDTWFSSGQWVYATLEAWNLKDTFFPTDVLVSAHDILENWDSRMMMFTNFHEKENPNGNHPFDNLFLTGLVLGTDGQKMSKSKGNMIDMDKIVTEYGTDAVRMVYFYQNKAGGNYAITFDKLKNFKQFMNKIWNASKFVMMNNEKFNENGYTTRDFQGSDNEVVQTIYKDLQETKAKVTTNINDYEFGYATETLYDKFWHTYCDVHIEMAKAQLMSEEVDAQTKKEICDVLIFALKEYLKMLHPFIPFITQMIWDDLMSDDRRKVDGDHKVLMYSRW